MAVFWGTLAGERTVLDHDAWLRGLMWDGRARGPTTSHFWTDTYVPRVQPTASSPPPTAASSCCQPPTSPHLLYMPTCWYNGKAVPLTATLQNNDDLPEPADHPQHLPQASGLT